MKKSSKTTGGIFVSFRRNFHPSSLQLEGLFTYDVIHNEGGANLWVTPWQLHMCYSMTLGTSVIFSNLYFVVQVFQMQLQKFMTEYENITKRNQCPGVTHTWNYPYDVTTKHPPKTLPRSVFACNRIIYQRFILTIE